MDAVGPGPEKARERPELIELVGLALLLPCAAAGWCSLSGLINELPDWLNGSGPGPWRALAPLCFASVVAAYTIKKSGLLVLAARVRGGALTAVTGGWWSFLAHFKLSVAALLASLVAGWFVRNGLIPWLVDPALEGWSSRPPLHFASPDHLWTGHLLAIVGVMWLPVVPFIASDVWRLLRPLMNARAARLRLPFALASGLVALGAVLLIRQYAWGSFSFSVSSSGL